MKPDWNPQHYLRYEHERNRAAADLLAQIAHIPARHIADLGCGAGNSTALLRRNWPSAQITGIDTSPAMLHAARQKLPDCTFVRQDFHEWQPETPPDLIFANASLQWSDSPETLLAHLIAQLAEGGVLAAQMPDNLEEPSHRLIRATAAAPHWQNRTAAAQTRPPMPAAGQYYRWLVQNGCQTDLWRTTYYHPLPDTAAIADMFAATAMRPYLDCLDAQQQAAFRLEYTEKLEQHYPPQPDGKVLLAVPRLFFVARKTGKAA